MKKLYSTPEFDIFRFNFKSILNGFDKSIPEDDIIRDDDIPTVPDD